MVEGEGALQRRTEKAQSFRGRVPSLWPVAKRRKERKKGEKEASSGSLGKVCKHLLRGRGSGKVGTAALPSPGPNFLERSSFLRDGWSPRKVIDRFSWINS